MITCEKQADVQRVAEQLCSHEPDWITFYREVLGLHGIIRHMFPTREMLAAFEQTEAYREILSMLATLRRKRPMAGGTEEARQGPMAAEPQEPTRVITVRLPKSLHDALRVESHEHRTSINKLCISKLLQPIDGRQVPVED